MKYYSTQEVADLFGFNPRKIRKLIAEKKLKAITFGSEFRISQVHIDEYLKNNCTVSDSEQETLAED